MNSYIPNKIIWVHWEIASATTDRVNISHCLPLGRKLGYLDHKFSYCMHSLKICKFVSFVDIFVFNLYFPYYFNSISRMKIPGCMRPSSRHWSLFEVLIPLTLLNREGSSE